MAVCPWCKAEVRDANTACSRCGKRPAEDVPDLILPTRHVAPKTEPAAAAPAKTGAPAPAGVKTATPAAAGGTANLFEDEDVFGTPGAALDLDLDLSKGPPLPSAPASMAGLAAAPTSAGPASMSKVAAAPAAPAGQAAPAPLQELAAPAPPTVDPFEAKALADYGPAPAQWWRTPLYAYRVKKRQPELKRALAAKKDEAKRAEAAAEDALIAFAENVRSAAEKDAKYASALDEVTKTEGLFRQRDTALGAEMDAHKQRQAQADAAIVELDKALAAAQAEEKVIVGELAEADALLKRAEAKMKRADIEIRNATAQLEPQPTQPSQTS